MKADQRSVTVSQDLIALYYVLSAELSSPHITDQRVATQYGTGLAPPRESHVGLDPRRY